MRDAKAQLRAPWLNVSVRIAQDVKLWADGRSACLSKVIAIICHVSCPASSSSHRGILLAVW